MRKLWAREESPNTVPLSGTEAMANSHDSQKRFCGYG